MKKYECRKQKAEVGEKGRTNLVLESRPESRCDQLKSSRTKEKRERISAFGVRPDLPTASRQHSAFRVCGTRGGLERTCYDAGCAMRVRSPHQRCDN
jgi:hypothetical protein